jgi:phosphotriesterase-related protein
MQQHRRRHAMTVTGPVDPTDLGVTLTHEHLFIDLSSRYEPVTVDASAAGRSQQRRWLAEPCADLANLLREDVDEAVHEVMAFADAGGHSLVDVTPVGLGRDLAGLRTVAERTGTLIVASTGFYSHRAHPGWVDDADPRRISEHLLHDLIAGQDGIRCGFIGELGVDDFLACEIGVVLAAVRAQLRTGASIGIHTISGAFPPHRTATVELVRRYIDAGGDPTRLVLHHQDGTGEEPSHQDRLLREGVTLSYDTFGAQTGFRREGRWVPLPSDDQRIAEVRQLWDRGYGDQIVLSHDVCYRSGTLRAGGWGLAHLLTTLAPRWRDAGLGPAELTQMLQLTPQRLLTLPGAILSGQPTSRSSASATTSTSSTSSSG